MLTKLLGVISVDSDITGQLLIIFSALVAVVEPIYVIHDPCINIVWKSSNLISV
jgi:hypothetical protein